MNRRKALVMHEIRTMRWILAAGIGSTLLFCLVVLGEMPSPFFTGLLEWNGYKGSYFSEILLGRIRDSHIVIWILFAIIVMVQFRDMHGKKTDQYMNSLPVTRRERFVVKSLVGYAVIFVSWLAMVVETLIIWQSVVPGMHRDNLLFPFYREMFANETVWHVLRTLGLFGLELMAGYAVFLLLHAMVSNGVAASLFALWVMAAPAVFCYIVKDVYVLVTGREAGQDAWGFEHLARLFFGDSLAVFDGMRSSWDYDGFNWYVYISYWDMWMVAAVILLVIAVCTAFTWKLARGYDLANSRGLVPGRGPRIFLSAGISFFIGSVLARYFSFSYTLGLVGADRKIWFFILWIIFSGVIGFAVYKVLGKRRR